METWGVLHNPTSFKLAVEDNNILHREKSVILRRIVGGNVGVELFEMELCSLLVFEESVNDASATAAAATFAFCYTNAEEMMSQQMR